MGLEEAGNHLCLQTLEPLEWTLGTQTGKGPQACGLCVCVRTDTRRGIHRALPHETSANRGAIQESPWRCHQEIGPQAGVPGSRPEVPARPTFGPAASRGQHDAAQWYPSLERRALRPVLQGKLRPGAAGRGGWTNRGVPLPAPPRPVRPGACPTSEVSLPDPGSGSRSGLGSTRHEVSAVAEAPGRGEAATAGWGVLYRSLAILRMSPGFAPLSEAETEAGGAGGKVAPGICAQMGPRCPLRSPESPRGPASRDTPSHPVVESPQPRVRTSPPGGSIGSRAPAGPPPAPATRSKGSARLSGFQGSASHSVKWGHNRGSGTQRTLGGEATIVMSLFLCLSFPASEAFQRPALSVNAPCLPAPRSCTTGLRSESEEWPAPGWWQRFRGFARIKRGSGAGGRTAGWGERRPQSGGRVG